MSIQNLLLLPKFNKFSPTVSHAHILTRIEEHNSKPFITLSPHSVLYRTLRRSLNELLPSKEFCDRFPGTIPVSLMRKDIDTLFHSSTTYGVLEKTDGVRYLLYFTTYKNQPIVALFDRAFTIHLLVDQIGFGDNFSHQGALLDTEYIFDSETKLHTFYIFDLLLGLGENCMRKQEMHYLNRLYIANTLIQECMVNVEKDLNIRFLVKNPYPIAKLQDFVENILPQRKSQVPLDGLIFIPLENKYHLGQDFATFKWKLGTNNTADFLLRFPHTTPYVSSIPTQTNLKTSNFKELQFTSEKIPVELWVDNAPTSNLSFFAHTYVLNKHKAPSSHLLDYDNKIFECRWCFKEKIWLVEKVRADKKSPNHLVTVKLTEKNIEENILIEELFCQCLPCRSKSKSKTESKVRSELL